MHAPSPWSLLLDTPFSPPPTALPSLQLSPGAAPGWPMAPRAASPILGYCHSDVLVLSSHVLLRGSSPGFRSPESKRVYVFNCLESSAWQPSGAWFDDLFLTRGEGLRHGKPALSYHLVHKYLLSWTSGQALCQVLGRC